MKTYPALFYDVMNGFTYILLSVWFAWCHAGVHFGEADTCMLYPLMFNCGGWYVMCAKSVAIT